MTIQTDNALLVEVAGAYGFKLNGQVLTLKTDDSTTEYAIPIGNYEILGLASEVKDLSDEIREDLKFYVLNPSTTLVLLKSEK